MTGANDTEALLGALADRLGGDDPTLRQLLLASLGESAGAPAEPDPRAAEEEVRTLRRSLRQSERLNRALMAKLEMLACALGACPSCWGADDGCPDCGGEGLPGRMEPDAQCFDRFVAPVLDRLDQDLDWDAEPQSHAAPARRRPRPASKSDRGSGASARRLSPIPVNKETKSDG
ncbi:hypothetical protein [Pontivivens ytuae]|uniref:Uncharacterized protein n=1 Tax=Pontivivens ytuae TaxID=2789856 RepID=A0A7S9LQF7_9RHOB|nr:hypothetical protein [Pontivivens ytuae]QPH53337.1 hypothetical protein I0K15_16320 [Pontivivens ytuae]